MHCNTLIGGRGVGGDSELSDGALATLRYNLARCQERCGDHAQAEAGYRQVLADDPDYVDCLLRLGYMRQVPALQARCADSEPKKTKKKLIRIKIPSPCGLSAVSAS
jgi:tetratricopeptide (TPR) repeat protein